MAPDNIYKTIHSHIIDFTENFCTLEDKHVHKECATDLDHGYIFRQLDKKSPSLCHRDLLRLLCLSASLCILPRPS